MGFFSRDHKPGVPARLIPQHVLALLAPYGEASLKSRSGNLRALSDDPRFSWDNFAGIVSNAMFNNDRERVVQEIHDAAATASRPDLTTVGGYFILTEFDPDLRDPRYLSMQDATLDWMHERGYSSGHLNGYEAKRWVETHGDLRTSFDHLEDVAVPEPGSEPQPKAMQTGESRLLARLGPGENDNRFFAERKSDGNYVVYSERIWSVDDPRMVRSDERQLGTFDVLPNLLRSLGAMLGTPTYWADEDLVPYFPTRRNRPQAAMHLTLPQQ
jgi:hypothetical protein